MTELESPITALETKPRSNSALALFLIFALPMPFCLFGYHLALWTMEQSAIISLSVKNFAWAGLIGLAAQAVVTTICVAALWFFTNDDRFKPIYAEMFGAAAMAFPALILRLLGPNNDQLGFIAQFLLCAVGVGVALQLRKNKIEWDQSALPFGLVVAGIGCAPFAIYGAFGSLGDIVLSLLASLAFGAFAATLLESSTGNLFLDGVGVGATLALLGSAIGYDGSQLILLAILPAFAFAVAAVMPSKAAAGAATTLLTFAGLALFDPTELAIVLGDVVGVAMKTCAAAIAIGFFTSAVALILRWALSANAGARTKRAAGWAGAIVVWMLVGALFFMFGNPGNYGDRLFVIMKYQADISAVEKIKDRNERLKTAYQKLTDHANASQADLRKYLDQTRTAYTPYYLENAIEVRGGILTQYYLASRNDVARVIPSPRLRVVPADTSATGSVVAPDASVQWNISMIGADKVWNEFKARGQGIVVGQSDTGADAQHPAIRERYRGLYQGDDYNWFDPWNNTVAPHDEIGHGTHTLGTILGANGIGVAPEAQWFACQNLDRNLGNPALYLDCMQFMLAPFPHGGDPLKDGDPTKAAHVINNSWGCPTLEGCDPTSLLFAAKNLRRAGVFVVVSTGNDGPNCETVESPLSLYASVFSVGAIDKNGNMASFSSRGPVTVDGSGRVKPDIVAPGVDIFSSLPNGTYGAESGTSMAGPHLVGVVALIWSAQPKLIGDIDATEKLIISTALPYTGNKSMGCFTGGNKHNNAYGYGVVDVYAAVKKALEMK
jgi:hypothetical protein